MTAPIPEKLKQILAGPDPPTAIMTSFDSSAESLYLQLGRLGLRVPEDISLVGFGGTWREGAVIRQLTSVPPTLSDRSQSCLVAGFMPVSAPVYIIRSVHA